MNKKLIALLLLALVAEQSAALAQTYVSSTYTNGECCPAPRPVSCCPKRCKTKCCRPRSCVRKTVCARPCRQRCKTNRCGFWRNCGVARRYNCRPKRGCCPRARCCRPKPACCPVAAPVCEAPACVNGNGTTTTVTRPALQPQVVVEAPAEAVVEEEVQA